MANALVSPARIDGEVRKALAKALRKDEKAIAMDASVIHDLGGTSLDFLDITFRLEQAFGIKLPHTLLVDQVEEMFGEGKAVDDQSRLTPAAVEIVRLRLGDPPGLEKGMYSDEVPALVTPAVLALGVKEILDQLPAACTHCGAGNWSCDDGTHVKCGTCTKDAVYPDGDALTRAWIESVVRERKLFAVA
jgi:acyl carrier protein